MFIVSLMLEKLESKLEAVGFQEKESKVYLAALELGQSTVQRIAAKAGIKRPTAYFVIEGLMERGLFSSFYQGKRQYFVAENPDRLIDILRDEKKQAEERLERLDTFLPELRSINNRDIKKPVVKYYDGKEGIISMVNEHTKQASGQSLCAAYSRDAVESVLGAEVLRRMRADRITHNISTRRIYTYSKGDMQGIPSVEALRLSGEEFPISCDIAIYDDIVRFASFKDRIVGVAIEDKEIAKSLRAIYELAWKWVKHRQKS